MIVIRHALVFSAGMFLASCDSNETLNRCLASTEQTILLRQITASGATKEGLNLCFSIKGNSKDDCLATYLDANDVVRQCMKDRWFTFTDVDSGYGTCYYTAYKQPGCYQQTLYLKLSGLLGHLPKKN